ncbi:hypothetical protein V4S38_04480 [Enterococcus cecorum]
MLALEENPILANYIEMHNAQKEAQRLAEQAENQQAEANVQEPQEVASQEKSNRLSDTEKSTNALADEVTEAEKNVYTVASNPILQDSVDNQEADEEQAKPSKKWRHLALAERDAFSCWGWFLLCTCAASRYEQIPSNAKSGQSVK